VGETVLGTFENITQDDKVDRLLVEFDFRNCLFNAPLKPVFQKTGPLAGVTDAGCWEEGRIRDRLKPMLNQHKLVVNEAHILSHDHGAKNLATEEIDRGGLRHQLTLVIKNERPLVNDHRINALVSGFHYSKPKGCVEARTDKKLAKFISRETRMPPN
jgi:hypothetical protein